MKFPAVLENLALATEFVEECANRSGLDQRKKYALALVLEEAFVNICSYAYPGSAGDAEISCGEDGGVFVLEIADSGNPFDVLSLPDPDTKLGIMERKIGGLGVHLIRKLSDSVSYCRENERNVLRMKFKLE
ncbi:ATP-binding protein [Desulfurivibrio sp. C05AmB]|uniref:ATP-binding protein n=1 Tax=Desulfurivibrio sp. C05AmB TaxID=3374371 RepID=UPI00376EACA0